MGHLKQSSQRYGNRVLERDKKHEEPIVLFTTANDANQLAEIGAKLVEEGFAACVSVVPSVRSIYRWQGEIQDETEALAIIKTTRGRFGSLRDRLVELHPYDVPELIALPIVDGLPEYIAWLVSNTRPPG
jgi:periplasmic divalent cation tolerance protein